MPRHSRLYITHTCTHAHIDTCVCVRVFVCVFLLILSLHFRAWIRARGRRQIFRQKARILEIQVAQTLEGYILGQDQRWCSKKNPLYSNFDTRALTLKIFFSQRLYLGAGAEEVEGGNEMEGGGDWREGRGEASRSSGRRTCWVSVVLHEVCVCGYA